ncbi:DUF2281 domain-containing protein [Flavobacterium sufflavum]|uniref:DUF2281 domain-containing protein n=1 Tax=Flavobacterium sufflavum TaxID=1921138 RepID=A0A3S2V6E5_9FLAO|nr:DUF2281 domain-containing protein [Flavobacterium sufflavum]RVT78338.1 DUF2281 domain-containing protein [Flavobacterium sufflavum]
MKTITPLEVTKKINALPASLLQEVDKYIDFLTYKYSDWAEQLSEEQIQLIEKGVKDIEENRLISHKEAKERIKNYIQNKSV